MSKPIAYTAEEREILRALEADEFKPIQRMKETMERYRQYALASVRKPRSINIRIGDRDLARIKTLAAEQGVPYQTFISALVHQQSQKRAPKASLDIAKSLTL